VRAAGDQQQRVFGHADLRQQCGHVQEPLFLKARRVELQAADDADGFGPAAQFPKARGIRLVLRAQARERGEDRAEQEAEPLVAAVGPFGKAGVDEEERDADLFGAPEEVGPDFRLNEHDGLGADDGQGAGHPGAPIHRIIDFADVRGQFAQQLAHAGGGGGGHDDLDVGHAFFQRPDQVSADVDFADADRVHPEHLAVGDGLLQFGVVTAKPLPEPGHPVSAPPHSQKIIGRRQGEEDGKQNVVEDTHFSFPFSPRRDCHGTGRVSQFHFDARRAGRGSEPGGGGRALCTQTHSSRGKKCAKLRVAECGTLIRTCGLPPRLIPGNATVFSDSRERVHGAGPAAGVPAADDGLRGL